MRLVLAIVIASMVNLYPSQIKSVDMLKSGSILCGGVGSGKSRTALTFFFLNICGGQLNINGKGDFKEMTTPTNLYIITTAKKRDTLEWERECAPFMLSTHPESSMSDVIVTIDSWNNLSKYKNIQHGFFIFDEQRLIGSGKWVKSFLKISRLNKWILLSATPGDTWTDYIPVFVANKFYKNRTEFLREHAVYNRFTKYPQIEKFIETGKLIRYKDQITVVMEYNRLTIHNNIFIATEYNKEEYKKVFINRWNIFKNKPIKNSGELCYTLRKIVNSHHSRIKAVIKIIEDHPKVIIFYNFNYELEMLRTLENTKEWNGHKHEEIPKGDSWVYLVQYSSGAEGWNCIATDTIIFFSQNYSYKIMIQAAGRIDRLNTKFTDLYYYHLRSSSPIDLAIAKTIKKKKLFNANKFMET